MSLLTLERLLAELIGLDAEAIGRRTFESVIHQRMVQCGVGNRDDYYGLVLTSAAEREELIEAIVVPETWFFRDTEPFRLIARHVTRVHAREPSAGRRWRVLSLPCATGEEAYSAAITLIDAGVLPHNVEVVGVDISQRSLEHARAGVYGARSFRGIEGDWWKAYFTTGDAQHGTRDVRQVAERVRSSVRFLQGNALDPTLLANEGAFDFVYCRNLLIYLTDPARHVMAQQFTRWLRMGGLLFLGHAEATDAPGPEFRPVDPPGAFAFVRADPEHHQSAKKWESLLQSSNFARKKRSLARPQRLSAELPDALSESPENAGDEKAGDERSGEWSDASLLADRGELTAATDLCERLISSKGDSARGYCLLGVVHQAAGRLVQAERCFLRALEIDPGHHESLVHLMFLCERDGRSKQAAELKRRVELATPRGHNP